MRLRSTAARRKSAARAFGIDALFRSVGPESREATNTGSFAPGTPASRGPFGSGAHDTVLSHRVTDVSDELLGVSKSDPRLAGQLQNAIVNLEAAASVERHAAQIFAIVGVDIPDDCAVVAANLALVCARNGYRTLLVDANLDAPVHDRLLNVANARGVAEFLNSSELPSAFIKPTQIEELFVMTAGSEVANPAALFDRTSLIHRLRSAANDFDLMLVDCGALPPQVASRITVGSSGAVIAAKEGVSSIRQVQQLNAMLELKGAQAAGIILTA